MNIEVIDGTLYQWDTGRKVQINCPKASEIQFALEGDTDALVLDIYEENGNRVANIPNELLQKSGYLYAYLIKASDAGDYTKHAYTLHIHPRPKPEDYVYTPTEIKRWETLEKRIKELEESGENADAVLTTPQTLTDEQMAQARANIGALDSDELSKAVDDALIKAKESGAFDGKDGDTPQKGVDYFTATDIQEIVNAVYAKVADGNEVAY